MLILACGGLAGPVPAWCPWFRRVVAWVVAGEVHWRLALDKK